MALLDVVLRAVGAGGDTAPSGPELQTHPLEAGDDLAGEVALDGVGLRQDEGALDGHAAAQLTCHPDDTPRGRDPRRRPGAWEADLRRTSSVPRAIRRARLAPRRT